MPTIQQHPLELALCGQPVRVHSVNEAETGLTSEGSETSKSSAQVKPLFGKASSVPVQKEKPVHRLMAYAAASGRTNQEIAVEFGYSTQQVANILGTPEVRQLIAEIIAETQQGNIEPLIERAAVDAITTMHGLCVNEKVAPSVRRAAAADLLDRFRGKPVQHVKNYNSGSSATPEAEIAKLREELGSV